NADATPVGIGTTRGGFNKEGQAAYDVLRGTSWVTYSVYRGLALHYFLAEVDVATGVATEVGEILDDEGARFDVFGVMVGTDGVLYSLDGNDRLWTIDPATAVATFVAQAGHFLSFGYDPVTDAYYGIDHDDYDLWEINVT